MITTVEQPCVLTAAQYGKDKVRVFRVVRDPESKVHNIVEYNITVMVEGAIETSFTQADNTVVVATDSNLAKVSPHVLDPARFGLHLGAYLLARYGHISAAFVTVEKLRWARIGADPGTDEAAGHKHAFWRDGEEKRIVEIEVARRGDGNRAIARVAGGLRDLLGASGSWDEISVLKTTGSAFENFVRDEHTTLVEVADRIFSTKTLTGPGQGELDAWEDAKVAAHAREITVNVFANDESASVQMAQRVLAENAGLDNVQYILPNKHYIPVDMKHIGVENTTP
ncbi:uricase [Russula earlei]|uniref:Uricase n=1 Tax=Russula earlei TaxID=71964 RepID=A0ACC0TSU0_9AGAM|nr:uricase [Russula earlei]